MKNNNKNLFYKNLSSEKASISVDFLFSFVLVMGLTYLILALSLTLSFIEVTQYITFSAARSYYASHNTPQDQEQQAKNKYNSLRKDTAWSHFFDKISWFKIDSADNVVFILSDSISKNHEYANKDTGGQPGMFQGVSTFFISKLLDFSLPFIGKTKGAEEQKESGFRTKISSFLGREPSALECKDFEKERAYKLSKQSGSVTPVFQISDNGC
ncbi:MAG: hypothetical protein HAW60_01000 [Bdellovibrionales bacterium]|nr:hypothetical protein [Bdellovibrionales bacterium]